MQRGHDDDNMFHWGEGAGPPASYSAVQGGKRGPAPLETHKARARHSCGTGGKQWTG